MYYTWDDKSCRRATTWRKLLERRFALNLLRRTQKEAVAFAEQLAASVFFSASFVSQPADGVLCPWPAALPAAAQCRPPFVVVFGCLLGKGEVIFACINLKNAALAAGVWAVGAGTSPYTEIQVPGFQKWQLLKAGALLTFLPLASARLTAWSLWLSGLRAVWWTQCKAAEEQQNEIPALGVLIQSKEKLLYRCLDVKYVVHGR